MVLDVPSHDIWKVLVVDPHLEDRRPIFATLPVLPTISVQVGGVAAIRVSIVAVLGVLECAEAKLTQIGEALGLPGTLPDPAKNRIKESYKNCYNGDND